MTIPYQYRSNRMLHLIHLSANSFYATSYCDLMAPQPSDATHWGSISSMGEFTIFVLWTNITSCKQRNGEISSFTCV